MPLFQYLLREWEDSTFSLGLEGVLGHLGVHFQIELIHTQRIRVNENEFLIKRPCKDEHRVCRYNHEVIRNTVVKKELEKTLWGVNKAVIYWSKFRVVLCVYCYHLWNWTRPKGPTCPVSACRTWTRWQSMFDTSLQCVRGLSVRVQKTGHVFH